MVGHKYNLKELIIDLKAEGINHTTTEFCQGRITRWGLAWTFQDYNFSTIEAHKGKSKKKNSSIVFTLTKITDAEHNFKKTYMKIKEILQNLQVTYKIITKRNHEISLDIVAVTNTWSNQRRKRRLLQRLSETDAKKTKVINEVSASGTVVDSLVTNKRESSDMLQEEKQINNTSGENSNYFAQSSDREQSEPTTSIMPVLHSIMKIQYKHEHSVIEMELISGSAGKEGLHQIIQYIKNNWK